MKTFLVFLTVLLVFFGVASVYFVDIKIEQKKREASTSKSSQSMMMAGADTKSGFFPKPSMRELDSLTANMNLPFTIENAHLSPHDARVTRGVRTVRSF
jgi:hypothetical protein